MWRAKKNWNKQFEQAIDPEAAKTIHPGDEQECSMCGKFCPIAIMRKYGLQSSNKV